MKNENVICVPLAAMKRQFDMTKQLWKVSIESINRLPFLYINRSVAETDFQHKQLIPYAVLQNEKGEVLCYQRHGTEKRLADIFSVGIGGHVNDHDTGETLSQFLINGLRREFLEEVGASVNEGMFHLVGLINEEETEVGHCHTGVVFRVAISNADFRFDAEIGDPQWRRIDELDLSKFELWSVLALKLLNSELSDTEN